MQSGDVSRTDRIVLAEQAVERLFRDEAAATYEPQNRQEANAAIRRLGQLFEELPGTITRALEFAGDSGSLLSSDRLQVLAEIIQNADDAEASEVRVLLRPTDLLVSHDGKPVRLDHVIALATPWISTKRGEAATIGRFGIGLLTLRSLSATIEVHCPPYHMQVGGPVVSSIDRPILPTLFQDAGWTTLRIPLEPGTVSSSEIEQWLEQWDDAALLFLRFVRRVTLLSPEGEPIRKLAVSRHDDGELVVGGSSATQAVSRQRVDADDGRSWAVYSADFRSPPGLSRAYKTTGPTTPIAVALPLQLAQSGKVYAGLPVAPAQTVLFTSAQFDPLTSRRDFADTEWNRALVHLVAELWSQGALDLFNRDPKIAWRAVPITVTAEGNTGSELVAALEKAVATLARQWLASRLSFYVPGQGAIHLSQLAVEAQPLEEILTEPEVASLAGLPATLPSGARDNAGRWRSVLEDWRSSGADLPEPVSVDHALDLIGDESRPVKATIALAAAALREDLGRRLLDLRCVIARDGRRLVPPSGNSPDAIAAEATPLAQQLGVVTLLHSAHLSHDQAAGVVRAWLEECGALLDRADDHAVVQRLAAAGRSGRQLETPLTDQQLRALRDAFEQMDPSDQRDFGPDVGRAIVLASYTYDGKHRKATSVSPADAYLPRRIDRETDSFAVAAEQTPGLQWLSDEYASTLRSPAGRGGLGAQRFLRLLGAETAPRLREHPRLERRFSDLRKGLRKYIPLGPEARRQAMQKLDATYTLRDQDSPDLQAAAKDISRERRKGRRRKRAGALLATLGRAWDRILRDSAEVDCASDYFVWQMRGKIRAFWLWELGDVAWLDDESGTPRRPLELQVRTPAIEAIHGSDSPDYLHRDLDRPNLRAILSALGVSSDPTRSELINRLRQLQSDHALEGRGRLSTTRIKQEATVVYKALAQDLDTTSRSDPTVTQLRREFQRGSGLVFTNLGWRPPENVLAGPPIFGRYEAFAPSIEDAESLWSALSLRDPSPEDCLKVLRKIARRGRAPSDEQKTILLETLRALAAHYEQGSTLPARRLTRLALWTSKGWVRDRPVYATDDPVLALGLKDRLPLWEPGGDLEQFHPLFNPLRIKEVRTADAEVIEPENSQEDYRATELFRSALSLLEEDLARNDPKLAGSIEVPWERLGTFGVGIHPSLSLRIPEVADSTGEAWTSEVKAKVDTALGRVFVKSQADLRRMDGGGRALAAVFAGNTRRLAQAWLAACDRAEDGIAARPVELAQQRAQREEAEVGAAIDKRTAALRGRTAENRSPRRDSARRTVVSAPPSGPSNDGQGGVAVGDTPRELVDPASLSIVDRRGRIEEGSSGTRRKAGRSGSLAAPSQVSTVPRNRSPSRGYTDLDRESVGMELVRMLLCSEHDEMVDLRTQRGVGADAIDSMKRFYELKVFAHAAPDRVNLTNAELRRALSTRDFFLIVVSGVEGADARPKVQVFVDPLRQLQPVDSESLTLSGVRSTQSLVYEFEPSDDLGPATGGEEQPDSTAS